MINEAKTIDKLSTSDSFKVMKLIESNGAVEDGFWVYNDGWDDERIARECGVPVNGVSYRRKEVFGQLRKRYSQPVLEPRIERLEIAQQSLRVADYNIAKRVEHLEKALNILLRSDGREHIPKEKLDELRLHFNGMVKTTEKYPS